MQAPIPKATLLQGLRPNLNEGDHCVFPPGFRVGKILPKGGSPFKQGEILQGGTQISYILLHLGLEMLTQSPNYFFEYYMKLFVLFLILTLYSAKQRVSVSLFFPINIIHLLGKTPLRKFHYIQSYSSAPIPLHLSPPRAHLGTSLFRRLPRSPYHFIFPLPHPI